MRALVVYESMFGNTRAVAEEIVAGLAARVGVDLTEVSGAPRCIGDGIGLLIVGGPTHAFGMTRASTRKSAAEQTDGELVSTGEGVREWLCSLSGGHPGIGAAAFDTRVRRPRIPGSAARGAQKQLRRSGFRIVTPARSFFVEKTTGPLSPGESRRAREWGGEVAAQTAERKP